jgi:DNA polymerase I
MGQGDDLLLGCDAGQLEYRILAHYLDDPLLIATFNDPTRDVHSETASLIFDVPPSQVTKAQRDVSKTAFYAILYGAAAPKLAATLNVSIGEAARVMSKIKSALNIDKLQTRVLEDVRRLGYVESLGGHRSYIHNIKSFNSKDRGHAERAAFDSLFQGTASGDVTKIACVRVQDALDKLYPNLLQPEVRLVLQVHDEILLEGPRHELEGLTGLVETSFINALPQLRVPLTAESKIGKSWSEVH